MLLCTQHALSFRFEFIRDILTLTLILPHHLSINMWPLPYSRSKIHHISPHSTKSKSTTHIRFPPPQCVKTLSVRSGYKFEEHPFDHLMLFFFTLQKELGFKVQIFKNKVKSYKKMTHKLGNTIEYIKVMLLVYLTMFILYSSVFNHWRRLLLYKLQNGSFVLRHPQSLNRCHRFTTCSVWPLTLIHACMFTIYVNSLLLTQYQAGLAEKQINVEFERLRMVLVTEEALRLKALATEEEQKIAAIQKLIDNTNNDIATMNKLSDTLQKEMGNEDLTFLRVREGSSSSVMRPIRLCLVLPV